MGVGTASLIWILENTGKYKEENEIHTISHLPETPTVMLLIRIPPVLYSVRGWVSMCISHEVEVLLHFIPFCVLLFSLNIVL